MPPRHLTHEADEQGQDPQATSTPTPRRSSSRASRRSRCCRRWGTSGCPGRLPREERITWPSDGRYPDAGFDQVFVKGIGVKAMVVPAGFGECSDHRRPVVVDITL